MRHLILAFYAAATLLPAQETASVLALDRQGQPVLDLKAEEVRLLADGRPMTVSSFTRLDSALASPTLVLFDLLNTATGARGSLPQQIAQAMERAEIKTPVLLYLLSAVGTLEPVHATLDQAMRNTSVIRPSSLDPVGARVKATYQALADVYAVLAPYRGRKTIVWITHGVPISALSTSGTPIDYLPALKKLAGGMASEQIVIYPVQASIRGNTPEDSSHDTLQELAGLTGGRYYPGDTVEKALTEALRDTAASYVLAFPAKSDGKFHTLRATCTRPGVRLQAQQGYSVKP
jgi:VWFA-related protein